MNEKKEYIEKKAAINRILDDFCTDAKDAIVVISKMPAADVVEVVRCEDCRYCGTGIYGVTTECMASGNVVDATDFCSFGEKETEASGGEGNT